MAKKHQGKRPSPIPILSFEHVPVHDFFEDIDLTTPYSVDEALRGFVDDLEAGYFLAWEAVVCQEEGLPLTKPQKKALRELVSFGAPEDDERILYIDGLPRPNAHWYDIAKTLVSHLVETEPFDTLNGGREGICEGWPDLLDVLETHASNLSLPEGVETPIDIFSPEIRHQLNLQYCLVPLGGLGQTAELSLEQKEEHDRVEWLIEELQEHKEMVRYFDLTLNRLVTKVHLPAKEETLFCSMLAQQLALPSPDAPLIDFLS